MSLAAIVRRLLAAIGLDRAVGATVLARGWPVLAGVVTIGMIGRYLTPELQGYYFTFGSLIGLQVIVELGLGYAIVQIASHEMAGLAWSVDGRVEGEPRAKRRLQSLLRFSLGWFGAAGLLLTLLLVPLGAAFLELDGSGAAGMHDATRAWAWLVPLVACQLVLSAALSLLEGTGQVAHVSTARLAQAVAGSVVLWLGLAAGDGLFALVAQAGAALLAGLAWVAVLHRNFFVDLLASPRTLPGISWRSEVWPFQWRIAVSWSSGYLTAQLFTPLLFASTGAVAAGQMGLSLQICTALNLLALAWVVAEAPTYGRLMALGQGEAAERLFARSLLLSSAVLLAMVVVLLALCGWLSHRGSPLAERVVPWPLVVWLGVATLTNHVVFAQSYLLRARREDPLMVMSVVHGLASAALAFLWVPGQGLAGAVAAYAVAAVLVGLPGGTAVYLRKRRSWRGVAGAHS